MKELIASTLKGMGHKYASKDAVSLVWATGLVESNYKYIRQISGPARGFFQIEPKTASSAIKHYFRFRKQISVRSALVSNTPDSLWGSTDDKRWDAVLESNIVAGIIHCRIKYWRAPAKMPDSLESYASYWKRYYNTIKGKGEADGFMRKVEKYADFL